LMIGRLPSHRLNKEKENEPARYRLVGHLIGTVVRRAWWWRSRDRLRLWLWSYRHRHHRYHLDHYRSLALTREVVMSLGLCFWIIILVMILFVGAFWGGLLHPNYFGV